MPNLKSLIDHNNDKPINLGEIFTVFNSAYPNGMMCRMSSGWKEYSAVAEPWWCRGAVSGAKKEEDIFNSINDSSGKVGRIYAFEYIDDGDEPEPEFEPVLYVVMRTDIPQMNPGKAIAQGMHGQSLIADSFAIDAVNADEDNWSSKVTAYQKWLDQANGFGTTIVLEASQDEWNEALENNAEFRRAFRPDLSYCNEIRDPTYPYTNHYGDRFTREEVTGWVIFAHTPEILDAMKSVFRLHR